MSFPLTPEVLRIRDTEGKTLGLYALERVGLIPPTHKSAQGVINGCSDHEVVFCNKLLHRLSRASQFGGNGLGRKSMSRTRVLQKFGLWQPEQVFPCLPGPKRPVWDFEHGSRTGENRVFACSAIQYWNICMRTNA